VLEALLAGDVDEVGKRSTGTQYAYGVLDILSAHCILLVNVRPIAHKVQDP
jgi:hypothetical protein